MRTIPLYLLLLLGQMITSKERPVVHLDPHHASIAVNFGGQQVQLVNAPGVVSLPRFPPQFDAAGKPWVVEVKNLGPSPVTVIGKGNFSLSVGIGQTVLISSNGSSYSQLH